jgi:hypothetical protein
MENSELKKQLHRYIDMIDDEVQLELLNDVVQSYVTKQPDILDLLTPDELEGLKKSIEQADKGETISHEEVMKMANEWDSEEIKIIWKKNAVADYNKVINYLIKNWPEKVAINFKETTQSKLKVLAKYPLTGLLHKKS